LMIQCEGNNQKRVLVAGPSFAPCVCARVPFIINVFRPLQIHAHVQTT
jgi:hypothetical protein